MGAANRDEAAKFLRARRARLRPADVGLPDVGRRRTPGLRRQEVAQLAGISVDYYVRLEQARGARPSRQVLAALARALLLTADEREYLFRVAGEAPPPTAGPSREVPAGIRHLLATLPNPAYVLDATYELLAWNRLATHFLGDPAAPGAERNVIRVIFRRPDDDPHWDSPASVGFAMATVADLRAAMARYPGDRGIAELVTELTATSARFTEMWNEHHVQVRRSMVKHIVHPTVGPLELDCQMLHIADTDQRLVIYTAPPGSPTEAAFRELTTRDTPTLADV
ncbi:helix-turn-helix transcriptional regulator [Amycolatopsis arida]|nr:helix-turn-helix transcriptional regulator [Amycolatopsis arida]